MSASSIDKEKYRPSLSASEIKTIMKLCNTALIVDARNKYVKAVLRVIAPLDAKVNLGIREPDYIAHPKDSLAKSLGFEDDSPISPGLSKEERWAKSYVKWKADPESCNLQELKAAKEHMYLHDLMTPAQEAEFELL